MCTLLNYIIETSPNTYVKVFRLYKYQNLSGIY